MYLCTILNMMIMPNKNIFVGFGLRSEFVSLMNSLHRNNFAKNYQYAYK